MHTAHTLRCWRGVWTVDQTQMLHARGHNKCYKPDKIVQLGRRDTMPEFGVPIIELDGDLHLI